MRIDIITPAFDVAPYIGDAIRSVLAQTHRYWTMTIVDDGSTDETAAIAGSFDDPRIRLLRQRNAGVSAARNLGLVASNAEAMLFLDGDDWLSPDALATLSAALREAPNAISPRWVRISASEQTGAWMAAKSTGPHRAICLNPCWFATCSPTAVTC